MVKPKFGFDSEVQSAICVSHHFFLEGSGVSFLFGIMGGGYILYMLFGFALGL